MAINEKYKDEFTEALYKVNEASEKVKNTLAGMDDKVFTMEEWNSYLGALQNLNNLNNNFKEAVYKYYGFRADKTGFE